MGGIVGLLLTVILLPACGSEDPPGNYLSIGDSYGQGLQPVPDDDPSRLTNGFAYLLPDKAKSSGWDLHLENFACGGATVESMVETPGCSRSGRSESGPSYDVPQLEAAIDFLKEHPNQVELITVVIGLNDLPCLIQVDRRASCAAGAVREVEPRLADALADLRAAAGPDPVIIGLSYPAMTLGFYVGEGGPSLATEWLAAFRDDFNPMLKRRYEAIDAVFVDVTAGTGAYTPFDDTTTLGPYGEIPVAVAAACQLTWHCDQGDVHPTDAGYEAIADQIVKALPPPPADD